MYPPADSFNGFRFKAMTTRERGIRCEYVAVIEADVNAKDGARK